MVAILGRISNQFAQAIILKSVHGILLNSRKRAPFFLIIPGYLFYICKIIKRSNLRIWISLFHKQF